MDTTLTVALIAAAASVTAAVIAARSSRRATDVNEQAANLGWVKELRQDALDTRKEMEACQAQARDLSRQLAIVTREAEHWISEYQFVHRTVWRDGISLDRLRELMGPPPQDPPPPTANGRRIVS